MLEPSALLPLAALLLATGLFAGLIAGLLGVGGGIVIVPVLFHVLTGFDFDPAVRMHLAVGTSLATIIATSTVSALSHYRRGGVDGALLKSWGPWIFVGVALGTALASVAEGVVLSLVFASIALMVALRMMISREGVRISDHLPQGIAKVLTAGFIGAVSAMMGIGGGTLSVPVLSAFGYPIRRAVGTAAAIGLIIAIPGTCGFVAAGWGQTGLPRFSLGYVNLAAFGLIVPATMLAAPWGARLAHTIRTDWLRTAFAFFLAVTSARMYWDALTG